MQTIVIHTDGGARGNPGPAGAGAVITTPNGEVLETASKFLGHQTNNWAEYEAVVLGLETALQLLGEKKLKETNVEVNLDSELVTRQLNGQYKIKKDHLMQQYLKVNELRTRYFPNISFSHVRREQNAHADQLANDAMDRGE